MKLKRKQEHNINMDCTDINTRTARIAWLIIKRIQQLCPVKITNGGFPNTFRDISDLSKIWKQSEAHETTNIFSLKSKARNLQRLKILSPRLFHDNIFYLEYIVTMRLQR